MKKSKKLLSFVMLLALLLSTLMPVTGLAEGGQKGKLTIHKLYFPDNIPEELEDGDWKAGELPEGTKPLDGAEFSIWKIGDNDELPSSEPAGEPTVKVTANGGLAVFDNLPLGRYYVKETGLPKGVTQTSEAFIVDIPSTSTDGREHLYDVHVYPKNAMTLGAGQLLKLDEKEEPLAGAKFDLYKVGEDGDEKIAEGLVTGSDGLTDVVGDLEVGEYYFTETEAPDGYGLDGTHIDFEIKVGDHAYVDGELQEGKVIQVTMNNHLKPTDPVKEVDKPSADIGETVRWTIKVDLPSNIATFKEYKITDQIDEALDYAGNLSVKLDGTELGPDAFKSKSEPDNNGGGVLTLDFNPAKLSPGQLVIAFDTVINEKAVVGQAIPNKAELDYDNGFQEEHRVSNIPEVVTGGAKFIKVDGKDNDIALEGAEFIVFKDAEGGRRYLVQDENGVNSWSEEKADATRFLSGSDGKFKVNGLAYGTYFLEETKAPIVDGKAYKLLQEPAEFVVDKDSYTRTIEIENREGPGLPKTGGMGTILFTVLGLGLMGVGAKLYKKED